MSVDSILSKKDPGPKRKIKRLNVLSKIISSSIRQVRPRVQPIMVELISHEVLFFSIIIVFFFLNFWVVRLLSLTANTPQEEIYLRIFLYISEISIVLIFVKHEIMGMDLVRKRKPPPNINPMILTDA